MISDNAQYDENLVTDNIKLIHKVIKDLNVHWSTEDEHQEYYDAGLEGLIRGAKTYDYSTKPGTYLYKCIKNMIVRQIYLSETDKRKINKENMISLDQNVFVSLDGDKETVFGDIIASDYDLEQEVENKIKIDGIIRELNKMENQKDALAIKMYYGLEGRTPKTYDEIAKEFGVSRNMINHRIHRALEKIKRKKSFLERNVIMQEKNSGEIIFSSKEQIKDKPILEQVNNILLEQLFTLKNLDLTEKEYSKMQIAKSNAIASTSKIILQSIGIQMMSERQKYKSLEYK